MEAAIARRRSAGPARYPVVIGGRERGGEPLTESRNPAHPDEIVGYVGAADRANRGAGWPRSGGRSTCSRRPR